MSAPKGKGRERVRVVVDPGVCGFRCVIWAQREGRQQGRLLLESECVHRQQIAAHLEVITLKGLFSPLSRNPIFVAAEKVRCHASCVIPVAVAKAAEVALDMALPRDVRILFEA
ncbi:MAG: DUF6951 family protein [Thermodesulfobacteriota bacterium]